MKSIIGKHTILTVVLLSLAALPAMAEMGYGQHKGGMQHMERMAEHLGLSDSQREDMQAVMQRAQERRMALRAETEKEMSAILTPEQQATWKEMKATRKERMREHKGRGEGCEMSE